MRLLDQVLQVKGDLVLETPNGERRLPGPAAIGGELSACPVRFVCDQAVTEAAAAVALDFTLLSNCMDLVRLPASHLWIEWDEDVRRSVFFEHGIGAGGVPGSPSGQRVGILARAEEGGRRGVVQVCWSQPHQNDVELSPLLLGFDFGARAEQEFGLEPNALRLTVDADPVVNALLAHVRFIPRRAWTAYYQDQGADLRDALVQNAMRVAFDVNMLLALSLLLAAREPLRQNEVVRAKLNQARLRRGKAALLDHVELSMPLELAPPQQPAHPADANRSPSRLHLVRAHLVRRGQAVFWRRAHLRGHAERGEICSRTVTLHAGRRRA